jgi:hypothetical protein
MSGEWPTGWPVAVPELLRCQYFLRLFQKQSSRNNNQPLCTLIDRRLDQNPRHAAPLGTESPRFPGIELVARFACGATSPPYAKIVSRLRSTNATARSAVARLDHRQMRSRSRYFSLCVAERFWPSKKDNRISLWRVEQQDPNSTHFRCRLLCKRGRRRERDGRTSPQYHRTRSVRKARASAIGHSRRTIHEFVQLLGASQVQLVNRHSCYTALTKARNSTANHFGPPVGLSNQMRKCCRVGRST